MTNPLSPEAARMRAVADTAAAQTLAGGRAVEKARLDHASMEDFRNIAAEAVEQRQRAERAEATLEAVRALAAVPDDEQEWELYDCEWHDCPGCEQPHLTKVQVIWTRRLNAVLGPRTDVAATAPTEDGAA